MLAVRVLVLLSVLLSALLIVGCGARIADEPTIDTTLAARVALGFSAELDEVAESEALSFAASVSFGAHVIAFPRDYNTDAFGALLLTPTIDYTVSPFGEDSHLLSIGTGVGYDLAWASFGALGGLAVSLEQPAFHPYVGGEVTMLRGLLWVRGQAYFASEHSPNLVVSIGTDVLWYRRINRSSSHSDTVNN